MSLLAAVTRVIKAFGYSCAGLRQMLRHPAFVTELALALILLPLACYVKPAGADRALLVGSVFLVLIVELLNTGIEITIDRISTEWHPLSKQAKDIGSAAVFLSLLNAACIWGAVLAA